MNAKAALLAHRSILMDRVRALDRSLADDLESVDRALEAIGPASTVDVRIEPGEFRGMRIFDAAKTYILRAKQAVPMPDLVNALISGGLVTKGNRQPEWKISQSVAYHVDKGRLTRVAGRIGLPKE